MSKYSRLISLIMIDSVLVVASLYISYLLRFDFQISSYWINTFPYIMSLYVLVMLVSFFSFKIYKRIWQYASIGDLISILKAAFFGSASSFVLNELFHYLLITTMVIPRSIYAISIMTIFLSVGGSRFLWRMVRDNYTKLQPHHQRALVIGAGEAGVMVVRELKHSQSNYYPIAFIDDNPQKQKLELLGVPVVGTRTDITKKVKKLNIHTIIIALPSASREIIAETINICKQTKCQIKIVPRVTDFINGTLSIKAIRDVNVEDLLGREPIKVDIEEISGYLKEQVVMITGAGGSIGSEICRQVASITPAQVVLLDHSENNIYDIELELRETYPTLNIIPVITDIQYKTQLEYVFNKYRPDVVFHAAAHKHVPLMEHNPREAVRNNVFGTKNVAECANVYGAKRFVLISTDKAVNPTSIMGTTKRIAEIIIQNLNLTSNTSYSAVRFGNVLGSRGSVIPLFRKQIEQGGPVTVTHPDMVRYFMTIPEAVQLVIQAGAMAKGGELFILDMGNPVKISDLAHDLIRLSGLEPNKDIKIVYTGVRPGEKLFEEILSADEGASATKHDRIFVGRADPFNNIPLTNLLNDLELISEPDAIIDLLGKLVPEFTHHNGNIDDSKQMKEAFKASLEVVATLEATYAKGST